MDRSHKTMMGLFGFVVLVLCAGSVVWSLDIGGFLGRMRAKGYWTVETKNDLHALAIDIAFATREAGIQPPGEIGSLAAFMNQWLPDVVRHEEERGTWDPAKRAFVDAWGNPLLLSVKSPHEYLLISAGRDGIYANGKGDDIVYKFDPWEFAHGEEVNDINNKSRSNR